MAQCELLLSGICTPPNGKRRELEIKHGMSFAEQSDCPTKPGSLEFIWYARCKHGAVLYCTNRSMRIGQPSHREKGLLISIFKLEDQQQLTGKIRAMPT